MKILFIGDSLFEGSVGVNFIQKLAGKHPDWQIDNEGVNGETLTLIAARLLKIIESGQRYDIIVLEAGANDILIPSFAKREYFFRKSYKYLIEQGYKPLSDPDHFETRFRNTLEKVKSQTKTPLILTTLACFNENLASGLNVQRDWYNQIIRSLAQEFNYGLADVASRFDQVLSNVNTRDYFLNNFWSTAFLDKFMCSVLGQADKLSKKRNLHLTIDGCHLNSAGADIFLEEIESEIEKVAANQMLSQPLANG